MPTNLMSVFVPLKKNLSLNLSNILTLHMNPNFPDGLFTKNREPQSKGCTIYHHPNISVIAVWNAVFVQLYFHVMNIAMPIMYSARWMKSHTPDTINPISKQPAALLLIIYSLKSILF